MKNYSFDANIAINDIVNWTKEYFAEEGKGKKAIIGISGGKDSTIVAALLVKALGAKNVIGVLMPEGEQFDIDDARKVCSILGIKSYEINIFEAAVALYHAFAKAGLEKNDRIITNTPSRIRMTVLYMVAGAIGGRVVNTCNFSEDYVGYSTKYGDLAGDFSLLQDFTVSEVIQIGEALKLPAHLVHKTPSDGMCGKSDEDNLGFTYKELDKYLTQDSALSYDKFSLIYNRHLNNLHKTKSIRLPKPYNKQKFENQDFSF